MILIVVGALAAALPGFPAGAASFELELIGTYTTGLADPGAGLAALKGDKLFVSNASDVSVDIVDVLDPTAPTLLKRVDLSAYGTEVTSVAVGNGLVAATVEAGAAPGTLVTFSPGGANLRSVQVGAGPDMVTFTPDSKRIFVANKVSHPATLPATSTRPVRSAWLRSSPATG